MIVNCGNSKTDTFWQVQAHTFLGDMIKPVKK